MWLAAIAVVVGVAGGLIAGGRLRSVAGADLRWPGLLVAAAAVEAVGSAWVGGALGLALVVAGYALMLMFALRNIAFTGSVLIVAGLAANLLVISLNGGMPVRGAPAGATFGPRHHGERPGDHLTALADVVPLRPLGETVSAGDLVLCLGVATMAGALLRPERLARRFAARRTATT